MEAVPAELIVHLAWQEDVDVHTVVLVKRLQAIIDRTADQGFLGLNLTVEVHEAV